MIKSYQIKHILSILTCFIAITAFAQTNSKFKVTLDAGHGGHDYGAIYNGHIEKNISLAIVLKVGKILEKNPNIDVNYTRKSDVFIELVERSNVANRADANIFVSIHCNANKNPAADGTETYVMGLNKNASNLAVAKSENSVITLEKDYKQKYEGFDPNNPSTMIGMTLMQEEYLDNSITLASKIQDQFVSDMNRKSRGVKQAPFMVLHKAYMPRVLIETGFISNPQDGALLDSEEGQDEMAQAIANAIIGYKKEYFGSGANEVTEKPSKKIMEKSIKDSTIAPKKELVVEKPEVKKPETKPEVKPEAKPEAKPEVKGVLFKVQITAVAKKLDLTPENFKGLKNVKATNDGGNLYKYTYGETTSYATAKSNLEEAKSKGYTSAYLIAYKDGKKISIQEAINNN